MDRNEKKICLVTGATSGVGRGMATGLALAGYHVVLVSRSRVRGEIVREEIIRETGNKRIELVICDLSLQSSIKNTAKEFKERFGSLHLLSNNVGGLFYRRELTDERIEKTLAIDYLSHFLLTHSLLDVLGKEAPSRILTVAGGTGMLKWASIHWDDPQFSDKYSGLKAALQAALMRVVWTQSLAKRLEGTGVSAFSFHPGFIRTSLDRNLPWYLRIPMRIINPLFSKISATGMFLATSPDVESFSGGYYAWKRRREILSTERMVEMGERLWEMSEKLCPLS